MFEDIFGILFLSVRYRNSVLAKEFNGESQFLFKVIQPISASQPWVRTKLQRLKIFLTVSVMYQT